VRKHQSLPWTCCSKRSAKNTAWSMCSLTYSGYVVLTYSSTSYSWPMLIWHMLMQCFLLRSSCDNAPGPRAFIKANFPGVTWRPRFWFQISNLESCTDMIQPCCVMACEAALRLVWPINRFLQGWGLEIWMLSYFSKKTRMSK
jgi:hypothetical protein